MSFKFDFDPDTHRYTLNGERLPSVTEVLEPEEQLDGIPAEDLARGRERGHHVHVACALLCYNNLEWSKLDPLLVPRVSAARKFLKETNFTILRVEHRMFDPTLKVAGTLDLFGVMNRFSWIIDWKSGMVSRTAGPQTAAYDNLFRQSFGGRENKRGVVELHDDGSYRLRPQEDKRDYSIFKSCLNLHHWRNRT